MREVGVKIGLNSTRAIEGSFEGDWESKLDFTVQERVIEGSFEGDLDSKLDFTAQELYRKVLREVGVKIGLYSMRVIEECFEGDLES